MTHISADQVKEALIDLGPFVHELKLGGPDVTQDGELPARISRLLTGGPGYCVCYGANKILAKHGLDTCADRETAYALLESIFKSALAQIDMQAFSVTPHPMTFGSMDVDGYNLNKSFSHDGKVQTRAFMSAKCIHFDAATPFIANIYGPNENIRGGHPLICDVKRYCRDRGLDPGRLVENIPNNYNIAIKNDFYDDLLNDYSFALDMNLDSDIIIVMLLNEIDFGVAHGATDPEKRVADAPARRPIRHLEYQYGEERHYDEWYQHYGLDILIAKDYQGENLSLDYHQPASRPYDHLIRIDN